jgi:DNA-binding NarL/FixJ family response regulator
METSPGRQIRVGLVEDKAAFRRGLRAILDLTPGIECVGIFSTAEEALLELPVLAPDVVLMDLNLPGRSGIECTREIRKLRPSIQVVMLTIEEDNERVFSALRAGAAGYLLKTATPAEIISAIELVARGGAPMSAQVARRVVESFHAAGEPSTEKQSLSPREGQVLERIAQGKRMKEVATELGVSVTTVQTYLRRIYEKLQVNSQAEAVARIYR